MLPIWSTVIERPASRMRSTIQSRPRLSSSDSARRVRPPRGVCPIRPSSSIDCSRRRLSILILYLRESALKPEICALQALVAEQVPGRALEDHPPALEHAPAVREGQGLTYVLLDQENGHAVAVDRANGVEDLRDQHGRETERRLVEHQDSRPGHQSAADRAHLLL